MVRAHLIGMLDFLARQWFCVILLASRCFAEVQNKSGKFTLTTASERGAGLGIRCKKVKTARRCVTAGLLTSPTLGILRACPSSHLIVSDTQSFRSYIIIFSKIAWCNKVRPLHCRHLLFAKLAKHKQRKIEKDVFLFKGGFADSC